MVGNMLLSVIVVLGVLALFLGFTNPWRKVYRQRWWEDQMASEKPFQMGKDQMRINSKQYVLPKEP